ncbi:MAG: hypothetical protein ABSE06_17985 [Anaerolineaceae bacterium]|jgi:hypothetical protein
MVFLKRLLTAFFIVILLGAFFSQFIPGTITARAAAGTPTPQPKKRITKLTVSYTSYKWWLIRWSTNQVRCQLIIDHAGQPTNAEIFSQCDKVTYTKWVGTQSCPQATSPTDASACGGMYLHLISVDDSSHEVEVELPLPEVWLSLADCNPIPDKHACTTLPSLVLQGEEPLPNESIIQIQGTLNGQPFTCPGSQCSLPLPITGIQGYKMEFWGDSSLGDSSEHFTAMVRVMPWGDFMNPEGNSTDPHEWYADVLSSQWRGGTADSCANSWQVFPDLGGPPPWLTTPDDVSALETQQSLYLLAGNLIKSGVVDVSGCPDGGMASDLVPNTCGLERATPKVMQWQNQFDPEILQAAQETGVPAMLIKSIFAKESQFWPGVITDDKEAGLGQMTEEGADTVLLWNPDFFSQFCPLVLDKSVCALGFGNLSADHQRMMRGALVSKVNATCSDCSMGIDLSRADFSVRVFAESLRANCEQTGQEIYNLTRRLPAQVSSFTDLWRLTVMNYNAGPGCLYAAMQKAWTYTSTNLNFTQVAQNLDPVCQSSITYLEDVSQENLSVPTQTPTTVITPGPSPTPTLRQTPTLIVITPTPVGGSPNSQEPP